MSCFGEGVHDSLLKNRTQSLIFLRLYDISGVTIINYLLVLLQKMALSVALRLFTIYISTGSTIFIKMMFMHYQSRTI